LAVHIGKVHGKLCNFLPSHIWARLYRSSDDKGEAEAESATDMNFEKELRLSFPALPRMRRAFVHSKRLQRNCCQPPTQLGRSRRKRIEKDDERSANTSGSTSNVINPEAALSRIASVQILPTFCVASPVSEMFSPESSRPSPSNVINPEAALTSISSVVLPTCVVASSVSETSSRESSQPSPSDIKGHQISEASGESNEIGTNSVFSAVSETVDAKTFATASPTTAISSPSPTTLAFSEKVFGLAFTGSNEKANQKKVQKSQTNRKQPNNGQAQELGDKI